MQLSLLYCLDFFENKKTCPLVTSGFNRQTSVLTPRLLSLSCREGGIGHFFLSPNQPAGEREDGSVENPGIDFLGRRGKGKREKGRKQHGLV